MSDDQNPLNPQDTNPDNNTPVTNPNPLGIPVSQDATAPLDENLAINPESPQNEEVPGTSQTAFPTTQDFGTPKLDQGEVVAAPHAPKKYGGNKVIATIFGLLVLIGGVTAGVILVQRQHQIEERAASGRECQQAADCILLDEPGNSGEFSAPGEIVKADITAKDVFTFLPGLTEDGCYRVNIEGRNITWQRYGSGPNCKDVSNVQVWFGQPAATPTQIPEITPTPPPGVTESPKITAECGEVKAYDLNWNPLSQSELGNLDPNAKIRFAVSGTASSGSFDKARFSVNNVSLGETNLKKPGSEEFYIEYTIPANTTSFTVEAEIHHSDLGWF
jgi:hypothetical protein